MRLAFIDFVYGYNAARPDTSEPLGGTTSAVCFLAREMAAEGISCVFFNRIGQKETTHDIISLPLEKLTESLLENAFDAYVFCGRWTAELVAFVRAQTKAPLIAWMHESVFTPPMTPALDDFDGVVFVSAWQQRINQQLLRDRWAHTVIRNAMNPSLHSDRDEDEPVLEGRTAPPVLLFAGNFARGAFHVPPIVEKVRAKDPVFSAQIFCNLDPSRNPESDRAYIAWLRAQPNIAHVGMVGQLELLGHMRRASIMLLPNMWPETSCIALVEGLASGLDVVATNRAALPETASGFARLIPVARPDEPVRFDEAVDVEAFAQEIVELLAKRRATPEAVEARLREQVDFFHAHYRWERRVDPWIDFIETLL